MGVIFCVLSNIYTKGEKIRKRKEIYKLVISIIFLRPSPLNLGHHLPSLPVALRYLLMRELKGKMDVVAPISAPMLQMVAMPAHAHRDVHRHTSHNADQQVVGKWAWGGGCGGC